MLAWLAPLLVLGLVIFVHELGHFLAAKWTGVYAPRFSLGWGPVLLRWRRGETEYVLSALPIGGYVRMASRDDETMSQLEGGNEAPREAPRDGGDWDPEGMAPFGPKPVPSHRWFESKPLWARLVIMLAGVTMNALLTLGVTTGMFAVNGRGYVPTVVDSVVAAKPAQLAGLVAGDSIVAVGGVGVRTWAEVVRAVSASPGRPVTLEVMRAGERRSLAMTPVGEPGVDPATGAAVTVGRVGMAPRATVVRERLGPLQAAAAGWQATWSMGSSVVRVVGGLVQGEVSMKNLGGPVMIARTSVQAARTGLEPLFTLVAFLSINLAVLNLLPIPVLDGGQILLNLVEAAKGSPFSLRTRERIAQVGVAVILLLFVTVMFNDVTALFRR